IDLNSLNGTFVNGKKVAKWILQHNDIITIGKHTLIYQDEKSLIRPPLFYSDGLETVTPEGTVMIDSRTQQHLLEEAIVQKEGSKIVELVGALSIISGKKEDTEIELLKRITTIGKGKNSEIKLKGLFLPKISAVISRRPAGYFLSYSEGRAIPKVNGESVTGQVKLKDGDIIEIAKLKMQFFLKPSRE
ncbi:MAG: FHA domain-containing protein, partial [Desulfobacterota bacterium]|nr:FHA domain-containing protein [Thermodesulfobacteriota bacterium]